MRLAADVAPRRLSAAERIRLAVDRWDSLDAAEGEAAFPPIPARAAELDYRVAEVDRDGDPGPPWAAVLG